MPFLNKNNFLLLYKIFRVIKKNELNLVFHNIKKINEITKEIN